MKTSLTYKQAELLAYIRDRLAESEVAPSFQEMKDALGLASKSGVHRLVAALEERGYIQRLPNRKRAISVGRPLERFSTAELQTELAYRRFEGRVAA